MGALHFKGIMMLVIHPRAYRKTFHLHLLFPVTTDKDRWVWNEYRRNGVCVKGHYNCLLKKFERYFYYLESKSISLYQILPLFFSFLFLSWENSQDWLYCLTFSWQLHCYPLKTEPSFHFLLLKKLDRSIQIFRCPFSIWRVSRWTGDVFIHKIKDSGPETPNGARRWSWFQEATPLSSIRSTENAQ